MSQKRAKHSTIIEKFKLKNESRNTVLQDDEASEDSDEVKHIDETSNPKSGNIHLEEPTQNDIDSAFGGNIVQPKAITNAKVFVPKKQKRKLPSDEGSMTSKKLKTSSKKRRRKLHWLPTQGSPHRGR